MALVIPTNQITVASRLSQSGNGRSRSEPPHQPMGISMLPMRTPSFQATIEMANWPAKRGRGGRAKRSSASPIKKKQRAPARVVQISWSFSAGRLANPPKAQTRPRAALKAITMPTPPSRTIGAVCCLRASGASTNPQRSPSRRTTGTTRAVHRAATAKVSKAAALGL